MVKVNSFSILTLILALSGFVFSIEFQGMAYLGKDGALTMQWYWLGAILSYGLSLSSIIMMFLKVFNTNKGRLDYILKAMSSFLIIASLIWTTFIVVAWQSGL